MKKVLFIDRDGTILKEPPDEQVDSITKMEFCPGAISNLARIARETNFELVLVSNQDGLGTPSFPEKKFWPVQNLMLSILKSEGVNFAEIHIDRTVQENNADTRKPGTGMLHKYLDGPYDLKNSYVIGDRISDVQLAKNLGTQSILLRNKKYRAADLTTPDWHMIYTYLLAPPRKAEVVRHTKETKIQLQLNLDGQGKNTVKTGIGFLDHMLDLFIKHASFDLSGKVKGDLEVDKHHTVEDTAIVLGKAIDKALGNKKGIHRYAFLVPMDEALARVAVDFCGRSSLVWKVKFKRKKIGKMPTELFYHFFKSLSDHTHCSLHIKVKGKNEHHKIEAVFKAVARCLRQAVSRDPHTGQIPSTKGVL